MDPLELVLATPAGVTAVPVAAPPPTALAPGGLLSAPVEPALAPGLIRRVLWGGDRRRGVARIELDGELAGTSIRLTGEGRALELEVVPGPGLDGERLAERLVARLGARGIAVLTCEVR
jgi:hypothetical protein